MTEGPVMVARAMTPPVAPMPSVVRSLRGLSDTVFSLGPSVVD